MIKVENVEIWGFKHAIRGMRNPMNSWDKSDSFCCIDRDDCNGCQFLDADDNCNSPVDQYEVTVGKNDLDLMKRLCKAGPEHRKYFRQIFVSMDIIAPLYWWKEFDTYKVGTVANSCSTMHKIHAKEFTFDDFSTDHMTPVSMNVLNFVIEHLNIARDFFINTKDKDAWWQMIQLLPSSYNQRRTVTMNYENVINIIRQRTGHKLDEWNLLVEELKKLPYLAEIMNDEE